MVLQAYDFVKLNEDYGCRVQFGGSDQWGNIVMGVELHRRKKEGSSSDLLLHQPIFGLTSPLITTASGAKMGKTAEGAVWLNVDRTSTYDYWQFWRNTEDADVGRFLKLFTELPLEEIARLETLEGAELNEAKKVLATEATALLHGRAEADKAAETAAKTFEQGGVGDDLPECHIATDELAAGIPAFKLFQLAGLTSSGKEARNLIKGNGARVNDELITDETLAISTDAMTEDGFIKLSAGKKRHALVKLD
jgi:tyrosyl-tRNA synthetase